MTERWQDVFPDQDWEFPDGDRWHVGGVRWEGGERYAMCTKPDGDVMLIPAATLVAQAKRIDR